MKRPLVFAVLVLVFGCSSRPPCDEPLDEGPGDVAAVTSSEPRNVKLVHYVSFDMGPIQETLTGYMILRAPDALRLYGMSETGQKAFEVAVLRGKVTRLYRAPFLRDDRVLDLIANAAQKIFLLRPKTTRVNKDFKGVVVESVEGGTLCEQDDATYFWSRRRDLRWLKGDKFSACFMDWITENGVYAARRIHFRSEEGQYPYELKLRLIDSKLLPNPPPDAIFEAPR
ncbi:MAG: hypothetical protein ACAI25_04760 [Planctomycetota bacterium]